MSRSSGEWLELASPRGGTIKVLKAAHPRARRLRLTVTPRGARLSYPHGMHPAQVFAFLRQHADWLADKLKEMNVSSKAPPALKPGVPTLMPLHGASVRLTWAEAEHPAIHLLGDELRLSLPRPWSRALPLARNLLHGFLEGQVRRDLNRWMGWYVPELGRAPTDLRIRPMKSLWGSLDGRDRVTLDLALALAPRAALHYVFVHELCHLRVRDHSPRFWHRVESLMPNYQTQRDWLRLNGSMVKAEMERLLADR
ncbi:MAG TPA: YgjP-like metallopeptidase domain-containing protein [Rhodanobacteraceae bacterium]|nr:YgjP-like metallopeptidase domain-containing protein [Rhodanobacteraceae bacterium]